VEVSASYDAVAGRYAGELIDELDGKPLDRWLLARVVDLADGGPILDAGCGPGHVTEFLARLGADATGLDLSDGMVAEAERRFPERRFRQGDIRHLPAPVEGDAWAAVVCAYSLIHFETAELPAVIDAIAAVVRPGGHLLVGTHTGQPTRHLDEWMDQEVDLDFVFHPVDALVEAIEGASFEILERIVRAPYAGAEAETERVYVLAKRFS
jgi:SAM-dependent methyltransferase